MLQQANPAARVSRGLWLPLPMTGGGAECPLWEDLQAFTALRRFPAA